MTPKNKKTDGGLDFFFKVCLVFFSFLLKISFSSVKPIFSESILIEIILKKKVNCGIISATPLKHRRLKQGRPRRGREVRQPNTISET